MAKKISHKLFHSKILLFGEHIINKGAMGLAIPLEKYSGVLRLGDLKQRELRESNHSIEMLANHIVHHNELATQYDTNRLLEDVERGLYFDSDIPQGYGLGSSAALVAAIYYEYYKFRKKNFVISAVKNDLAQLESYYHGKSSGLDAIVSYLNKAVLVNNGEVSEVFDLPESRQAVLKVFVINTHIARKTGPFVNLFLEKCKEKKFMDTVQKSLVPTTNIAIDAFMQRNYAELMKCMKVISQLQLDMLPEFIPKKFVEVWQLGLKSNNYHLKICGAGGGGFIIGFARADADLDILMPAMDVIELMRF
ncbi:MAG: hypothetical protein U0V74_15975 [Chitinophagales bacterium]